MHSYSRLRSTFFWHVRILKVQGASSFHAVHIFQLCHISTEVCSTLSACLHSRPALRVVAEMQHPLLEHEPPGRVFFKVVNFAERVLAPEAHVISGSDLPDSHVAHNDASHEAAKSIVITTKQASFLGILHRTVFLTVNACDMRGGFRGPTMDTKMLRTR